MKVRVFAGLTMIVLAGCGASAKPVAKKPNYSAALSRDVMTTGTQRLHPLVVALGGTGPAKLNSANCLQVSGTERYRCTASYTYYDAGVGAMDTYKLSASGSCHDTGGCAWQPQGSGSIVGQLSLNNAYPDYSWVLEALFTFPRVRPQFDRVAHQIGKLDGSPHATATAIDAKSCSQQGGTVNYSCHVTFTLLRGPNGPTQEWQVPVSGSCKENGVCTIGRTGPPLETAP